MAHLKKRSGKFSPKKTMPGCSTVGSNDASRRLGPADGLQQSSGAHRRTCGGAEVHMRPCRQPWGQEVPPHDASERGMPRMRKPRGICTLTSPPCLRASASQASFPPNAAALTSSTGTGRPEPTTWACARREGEGRREVVR